MKHALTQKVAVVFSKTGPAIYHSHHDLIRFWERAVKRAKLPMRMTQGFNPRPRIIFPHALALGISSLHEEVELELYENQKLDSILDAVRNAAGDTFGIEKVVALPPVKKSRQITSSSYVVSGWKSVTTEQIEKAARSILDMPEIIVQRGAPNQKRSVDVRPFLKTMQATEQNSAPVLLITLTHTQTGSAKADEIASAVAGVLGVDKFTLSILKTAMNLE